MSGEPSAPQRLARLSAGRLADRTLENLLRTLCAKLDLGRGLPIYEYEAEADGALAGVQAFHDLGDAERRSFEELLACLREHLDETRPRELH